MIAMTAQFKQQIALALSAAFCVLVFFTVIYIGIEWRSDWRLAHQKPLAPLLANTDTANLITAIPDEHLFGSASGNMPITNLQLQVTGIVKVEKGNHHVSKAYISISGQPSKIYRVGDALPAGVKIQDITLDAVILENDGRLEKLPLAREKLEFKPRNTGGN